MKKIDLMELFVFVGSLLLLTGLVLGGFYLLGYMVELIANNISPVVISALCITFVTILLNLALDNKI